MNDVAIQKIINYANEHLLGLGSTCSKQVIMEKSYECWAVDEILLALMDHPLTEAEIVIERFIIKMELFLHISDDPQNDYIFTIAANMAEKLLGLIS